MKILLIEDDPDMSAYLQDSLTQSGFAVDTVNDGRDGLHLALSDIYEAIIVDRMLPGLDGLSLVSALRAANNATPALFLTALADVDQRVEGLRAGADDYLTKPFAYTELLARIEVLVRRQRPETADHHYQVADLQLDRLKRTVRRGQRTIDLQPREFRLLEFMMANAGQVVTRTMLLEKVWDYHFDPQTNVIDVHISRLRAKIDRHEDSPLLHTIRGAGYCLREPE
ncbi:MAG: response regulator transcription factor [Alcanivorax sp.]|nr:response regulator transcription factor [Alcanivorax sp.]